MSRPATARLASVLGLGFVPARAASREDIEAAIEAALDTVNRLISYLDALDGDADLEPEEPESGAREWCGSGAQRFDVGAVA